MANSGTFNRRDLARIGAGIAVGSATMAAGSLAAAESPAHAPAKQVTVPADDKLAIMELIALYTWSYDTGDTPGIQATFTDDGKLYGFHDEVFDKEAMTDFFAGIYKMRGSNGWQHLNDHHVFRDYDGENCTVYSYYTMVEADAAGSNGQVKAMGYYISHCRKIGGEWKFAERRIIRWDSKRPW